MSGFLNSVNKRHHKIEETDLPQNRVKSKTFMNEKREEMKPQMSPTQI